MKNSERIRWFERAYERIREEILPEAPPSVTLTIGFPLKKKSGKYMTVGECAYDCMVEHGDGFGAEHILTLHPIQGNNLITMLGTLVHEMIHCAEPTARHGKAFQKLAKRVGLLPPWTATEPDEVLSNKLRGILLELEQELGYVPVGHYVAPPPPPKKPSTSKKLECGCKHSITLSAKKAEQMKIICGICEEPFVVVTAELETV